MVRRLLKALRAEAAGTAFGRRAAKSYQTITRTIGQTMVTALKRLRLK